MTHTPGKWTHYDDTPAAGKNNRHEIVAMGKTICHIYSSVPHQDLANARLIAAAPELLKSLENMLYLAGDDNHSWAIEARAIIAKARGQS